LEIHAAGFALTARARSDREIVRSTRDRFYKPRYERWHVAAVAIEKHYDVIPRLRDRNRVNACRARSPVTTRRCYDARSGFTRPLSCAIGAAVINNDYFARHAGREAFVNHARDRFLFV
jgi:hypothetical protein